MHALQIVWDPATEGINIFDIFTIHYYSMMWMVAFILGWYIIKKIYTNENQTDEKLDALFIYSVVGIMVGARLGHVIFYQPELIKDDFFSIFLPFKFKGGFAFTGFRGLASHGAAIGMIISMHLYNKKILKKSVLWILDRVVVPVASGAIFVRIGNFFNSEMIGKPAEESLPWAIIFKDFDNVARHPGTVIRSLWLYFCIPNSLVLILENQKRKSNRFFIWSVFGAFNDRKIVCRTI